MPIAAASKGGPPPDSASTTSQGRSRSRTGSRTPFSRFEIGFVSGLREAPARVPIRVTVQGIGSQALGGDRQQTRGGRSRQRVPIHAPIGTDARPSVPRPRIGRNAGQVVGFGSRAFRLRNARVVHG